MRETPPKEVAGAQLSIDVHFKSANNGSRLKATTWYISGSVVFTYVYAAVHNLNGMQSNFGQESRAW